MRKKIVYSIVTFIIVLVLSFTFISKYKVVNHIPIQIKNLMPDFIVSKYVQLSNFLNKKKVPDNFLYNVLLLPETQFANLNFEQKSLITDENKSNDMIFKKNNSSERFFVDVFNENVILSTFDGNLYYFLQDKITEHKKKKLKLSLIETNLKKYKKLKIIDAYVENDDIFISTYQGDKFEEHCNFRILHSKLNLIKVDFERIFIIPGCINSTIQGGRIQSIDLDGNRGLIFTTAANNLDNVNQNPQNDESFFGKILYLNLDTKEIKIFSKGHRNPQGLFVKNNIVLSTEHGPEGGDEINLIKRYKNYGWPIASYGKPYKSKNKDYLKNHEINGFEEPIYTYFPAIGISDLIEIPEKFLQIKDLNNLFFVSSLMGRSLHLTKFSKNYEKVLFSEKIYLNRVIRDLKYIEKYNLFILSLGRNNIDSPSQLGILSLKKNR
tara:strand:- start:65 stop:1375 length:1311 start_codon:yes stop_codon:yes gene_type:complete